MRHQDLRSVVSSKWDQVVARTQTVGELISRPAEHVNTQELRDLAVAIKADADAFKQQFASLTPGQQEAVCMLIEAIQVRTASVLQVATGIESQDTTALVIAQFLWEESGKKARQAYAALSAP